MTPEWHAWGDGNLSTDEYQRLQQDRLAALPQELQDFYHRFSEAGNLPPDERWPEMWAAARTMFAHHSIDL